MTYERQTTTTDAKWWQKLTWTSARGANKTENHQEVNRPWD